MCGICTTTLNQFRCHPVQDCTGSIAHGGEYLGAVLSLLYGFRTLHVRNDSGER